MPSKDENETEDTEPQGINAEDQPAKPASVAQSEADTPSLPSATVAQQTPAHARHASTTRAGVQVVPVVPLVSQSPSASKQSKSLAQPTPEKAGATEAVAPTVIENGHGPTEEESQPPASSETTSSTTPSPAPQRAAPKSWADLVRSKAAAKQSTAASPQAGALALTRGESLAEALNSFGSNVDQYSEKIAFLEPRGLVNTGNMCYMNSVSYPLLTHISNQPALTIPLRSYKF